MFDLTTYNTFGIQAKAKKAVILKALDELQSWRINNPEEPYLILGGGSNILFIDDPAECILINRMSGIEIIEKGHVYTRVSVAGGVNWHDFVTWAVKNKLGGIENLALIPGTVGAAPVQNIGAYGVEVKDVIEEVEYMEMATGERKIMTANECAFAYRSSIFKQELKNKIFISKVQFKLTHTDHRLQLSYGPLARLTENKESIGIQTVFDEVIRIRQSKLPDPALLGNAGSFFKNPVMPIQVFWQLQNLHPDIPHYHVDESSVKIPAGWLVEQAGWKGKRIGNAGCYEKQALVLVNHGQATGREIYDLANHIKHSVFAKFAILLQEEVNIIPSA